MNKYFLDLMKILTIAGFVFAIGCLYSVSFSFLSSKNSVENVTGFILIVFSGYITFEFAKHLLASVFGIYLDFDKIDNNDEEI